MTSETVNPIAVTSETQEEMERRSISTIRRYANVPSEEPLWGDIGSILHEGTFNPLFASLEERGLIREGITALFWGSHNGYGPRLFKEFVGEKGYNDLELLALEIADWNSQVPGVTYYQEDALHSSIPPESVDLLIDRLSVLYTCFKYYPKSGTQALVAAHRVLREDGTLIVDGGDLVRFGGINTYGSSATQIEEANPELFKQMESGFVHLVDPTKDRSYKFEVKKFDVRGMPHESKGGSYIRIVAKDGEFIDTWTHYELKKAK